MNGNVYRVQLSLRLQGPHYRIKFFILSLFFFPIVTFPLYNLFSENNHSSKHAFIFFLLYQTFTEHLLYARPCG